MPLSAHLVCILAHHFLLWRFTPTQQSNHSTQTNNSFIGRLHGDLVQNLASYLGAKELAKFGLTCKSSSGLVDIVAKQIIKTLQTEQESRAFPKYDTESWIEYYFEYEKSFRSPIIFDQMIGMNVHHEGNAKHCVVVEEGYTGRWSTAISNQTMRGQGKHYAMFSKCGAGEIRVGIIRPIQGIGWRGMDTFSPFVVHSLHLREELLGERTEKWGNSGIHCCMIEPRMQVCASCDWEDEVTWDELEDVEQLSEDCTFCMLLDLDEGTLTVYQHGQPLCQLKDGLSGEYCWATTMWNWEEGSSRVSIKRAQSPMP